MAARLSEELKLIAAQPLLLPPSTGGSAAPHPPYTGGGVGGGVGGGAGMGSAECGGGGGAPPRSSASRAAAALRQPGYSGMPSSGAPPCPGTAQQPVGPAVGGYLNAAPKFDLIAGARR